MSSLKFGVAMFLEAILLLSSKNSILYTLYFIIAVSVHSIQQCMSKSLIKVHGKWSPTTGSFEGNK